VLHIWHCSGKIDIFYGVFSYTVGVAADSWQALMDRFLTLGSDQVDEKHRVERNLCQLIDIYYDAIDAPKNSGLKVSFLFRVFCYLSIGQDKILGLSIHLFLLQFFTSLMMYLVLLFRA